MTAPPDSPCLDYERIEVRLRLEGISARLLVPLGELACLARGLDVVSEALLGPSNPSPPSLVRLPARLLRDTSPNGPLETALRCLLFHRPRSIELLTGDCDQREEQLALLKHVVEAMEERGVLAWPKLAFDRSVKPAAREELARIATKLRGEVVSSAAHATHVVCWDAEVDGADAAGDDDAYLRTLHVDSRRGLALVHWWYKPDSRDEWIEKERVEGAPPARAARGSGAEPWTRAVPSKASGAWRVSCRFVRDAQLNNEWGCELDYDLDDEDEDEDEEPRDFDQDGEEEEEEEEENGKKRGRSQTSVSGSGKKKKKKRTDEGEAPVRRFKARELVAHDASLPPSRDEGAASVRASRDVVTATIDVADRPGGKPGPQQLQQLAVAISIAVTTTPRLSPKLEPNAEQSVVAACSAVAVKSEQGLDASEERSQSHSSSERMESEPSVLDLNVFDCDRVSRLERACVPEWFCGDVDKSPEQYLEARNWMIAQSNARPQQPLTATFCRQRLGLDACAALRLFDFVDAWGLVNANVPASLRRAAKARRKPPPLYEGLQPQQQMPANAQPVPPPAHHAPVQRAWSHHHTCALLHAARSERDDWAAVAARVNAELPPTAHRFDPADCVSRFVELPLRDLKRLATSALIAAVPVAKRTASAQLKVLKQPLDALVEARLLRIEQRVEHFARVEAMLDSERATNARERARLRREWADLAVNLE